MEYREKIQQMVVECDGKTITEITTMVKSQCDKDDIYTIANILECGRNASDIAFTLACRNACSKVPKDVKPFDITIIHDLMSDKIIASY